MPDYDPKSIPILDDVIENNAAEIKQQDSEDNLEPAAENNLDLFTTDTTDSTIDNSAIEDSVDRYNTEDSEPQIGTIDDFINEETFLASEAVVDDAPEEQTEVASAHIEPALIDFDISKEPDDRFDDKFSAEFDDEFGEEPDTATIDAQLDKEHLDDELQNEDQLTEKLQEEETQLTAEPVVTLNTLADDIVQQLMPELEQQMRSLVKQTLEDRLPDEIKQQLAANKDDAD